MICLLAKGTPPREIAAITFTEFAAGELRERIAQYLDAMLSGAAPEELRIVYPEGPTAAERVALQDARQRLDELTSTTIHGFCHALLRTYAIEAAIDPGAEILDSAQADLAFRTIFERWLRDRLDRTDANDPIARTAEHDPIRAEELLREFAECRRRHRTARPPPATVERGDDVPLSESVAQFRRWFNSSGGPAAAEQDIAELEQLARHFQGKFDPLPGFGRLWELAHPPRVTIMRKNALDLVKYRRHGAWRGTKGKVDGPRFAEEAGRHYDSCATAFRHLVGKLATAIIASFATELDELLERFERSNATRPYSISMTFYISRVMCCGAMRACGTQPPGGLPAFWSMSFRTPIRFRPKSSLGWRVMAAAEFELARANLAARQPIHGR